MTTNKEQATRIQTFDVLKAIAILAVVYTHCLQFMGIGNYWHHPIFKLTYAFHMPLFMVISGYFACHSLQLPLKDLIKKKSVQLLLPCITAAIVVIAINRLIGWNPKHAGLMEFATNLWYLKSLFACFVIGKLASMCCKGKTLPTIIVGLLLAFPIHLYHVNFMMPFFWMGYAWRKKPDVIRNHSKGILLVSLLIFGLLWPFWDGYYTTYATPLQLVKIQKTQWMGFGNLLPYCLRTGIGIAGTGVVVSGVYLLEKRGFRFNKLSEMGKYTLELYTLHFLFINTGLMAACSIPYHWGWYEVGYCGLTTLLLLGMCYGLIKLIHRFRWTSILFFGK